jgi:hypothetical protein
MDNKNSMYTKNVYEHCYSILEELSSVPDSELRNRVEQLKERCSQQQKEALPDMISAVRASHKILCGVKEMDEKAAFGQDPAIFYGLALAGEIGELSNGLIKVVRAGGSIQQKQTAVQAELPDVIIYSILLGDTTDIDIVKIVADKAKVVTERALSGYYGGPLHLVK